ncbi:hypothetical protein [Pectobacterium polaris]|uniref:hypothetical protein n=1 Tax=Pectobacterium polaris TaxID=2042057 RepID=UPI003F4EDDFC
MLLPLAPLDSSDVLLSAAPSAPLASKDDPFLRFFRAAASAFADFAAASAAAAASASGLLCTTLGVPPHMAIPLLDQPAVIGKNGR